MTRKILHILVLYALFLAGEFVLSVHAQDIRSIPPLALEHYRQGVFYGKQEKYVEAIMELEKAIAEFPGYADAYNALGVVYHKQAHYQQAIEQYLSAIEANPHHAKARTNLALVYRQQQEYRKALQQLEKALESDPEYALANQLIEKVREKAEKQEAEERQRQQQEAQQALKATSEKPETQTHKASQSFFDAGTDLIRQGRVDAGIQQYRQGLKVAPRSAEGHTLLGMAYREKFWITTEFSWRQEEVAAFQKALAYHPGYAPAWLGLGETYYAQGDFARAFSYFQKVLESQPDHPGRDQLEAILGWSY